MIICPFFLFDLLHNLFYLVFKTEQLKLEL